MNHFSAIKRRRKLILSRRTLFYIFTESTGSLAARHVPLLVAGDSLHALRGPVGGSGDRHRHPTHRGSGHHPASAAASSRGSPACRGCHLDAEIREDPDHGPGPCPMRSGVSFNKLPLFLPTVAALGALGALGAAGGNSAVADQQESCFPCFYSVFSLLTFGQNSEADPDHRPGARKATNGSERRRCRSRKIRDLLFLLLGSIRHR